MCLFGGIRLVPATHTPCAPSTLLPILPLFVRVRRLRSADCVLYTHRACYSPCRVLHVNDATRKVAGTFSFILLDEPVYACLVRLSFLVPFCSVRPCCIPRVRACMTKSLLAFLERGATQHTSSHSFKSRHQASHPLLFRGVRP